MMSREIRNYFGSALLLLALLTQALTAQAEDGYREIMPPISTQAEDKIEVLELFWYACPSCWELKPHMENWASQLPDDVVYRRLPAILADEWEILAKVYFAFEELGMADAMHESIYFGVIRKGMNWPYERYLFDWVDRQGLDVEQFVAVYRSDTVHQKVLEARQLDKDLGLTSVPAIIIEGRYHTSSQLAKGAENVPSVIDMLIAKLRQEKSAAPTAVKR